MARKFTIAEERLQRQAAAAEKERERKKKQEEYENGQAEYEEKKAARKAEWKKKQEEYKERKAKYEQEEAARKAEWNKKQEEYEERKAKYEQEKAARKAKYQARQAAKQLSTAAQPAQEWDTKSDTSEATVSTMASTFSNKDVRCLASRDKEVWKVEELPLPSLRDILKLEQCQSLDALQKANVGQTLKVENELRQPNAEPQFSFFSLTSLD